MSSSHRISYSSWLAPGHLIRAIGLFFGSLILFLINIQYPKTPNFDEFHYIPSAKQFLELKVNQNWEHPPLGKLLMAVGIGIWGDQPLGWRFMSTLFGALTLVGTYFLAATLFESAEVALWVALLTLFNQLLYVQSRIGMLDTFMMGFLIWAMAFFCRTWSPENLKSVKSSIQNQRTSFLLTGVFLGLATACKWFAFVPWAAIIALFVSVRVLQKWGTVFLHPHPEDWYFPQLWKGIRWSDFLLSLVIVPLFCYFLTFVPFLFIQDSHTTVLDFFKMQYKMWDGQLRVVNSHPYMSQWKDWPLISRPIWYAFDREGPHQNLVRGVLLLGNPWIMWTGLVALLGCLWGWIQHRHKQAFLILFFYFVFYFSWILIPRKIAFYYYYYPAGMVLSFAIAYCFSNPNFKKLFPNSQAPTWIKWTYLGIAVGFFIYFFPILGALPIPVDSFRRWMWFSSWI